MCFGGNLGEYCVIAGATAEEIYGLWQGNFRQKSLIVFCSGGSVPLLSLIFLWDFVETVKII